MSKLVIKQHRPLEIVLVVILLGMICAVLGWVLLEEWHWDSIKQQLSDNQQMELLWGVNQTLEKDNATLTKKVIMLERSMQVDNEVAIKLQADIRLLQEDIYKLKAELEFYEGIMSIAPNTKGLSVQGLHIEKTEQEQVFRFKLILTNVVRSDKAVAAQFALSVEGKTNEGTKILALKDILIGNDDLLKGGIKLKNFERIEGSLEFPPGFKPLRVIVTLQQKGVKKSRVKKVFDWTILR